MPEEKILKFTASGSDRGLRLDILLFQHDSTQSRSFWQKLIRGGKVSVNGSIADTPKTEIRSGDEIVVALPQLQSDIPEAENFEFPIIFEDEAMLVINKPAGVVVHPAPGNRSGTIVNALLGRYPGMSEDFPDLADGRPGIVHRLDKDTSGLLVIAKTPAAQYRLSQAFANRETAKTYLAIVCGTPERQQGTFESLIGRHPVNRKKMAVVERNGKIAKTAYKVKKIAMISKRKFALLEVDIFTGRTHQIRVHLSHAGFPVAGDELYGGSRNLPFEAPRQMLHAYKLALPHPVTRKIMEFTAPVPDDMRQIISLLDESAAD